MAETLKEMLNKKKAPEPPKNEPKSELKEKAPEPPKSELKKKAPSPPPSTKITNETEATENFKKNFVKEQVLSIVKDTKTFETNLPVETSKKRPPFPYTIQRNVCYEINTTTEQPKALNEPDHDILKRSPTDCIYHISAKITCPQNTVSLPATPWAHFTGNIQSLEVTLPANKSTLNYPPCVLYATPIHNSTDEHNHMVYDSTKRPLGKVTSPPEKNLYDPGSSQHASTTRQVYPSYKETHFFHTSPRFSRYELCHDKEKPILTPNKSFLNTSRTPNLYPNENYNSASCKSVIKEPFGPHLLDNRLGHSPWNQLERQANPFRSTFCRPNETHNLRLRERYLANPCNLKHSNPVAHTKHFYPLRGNPNFTFRGGLTTYKKAPYKSLADMATYYSNLEYEDQQDVISLLLSCRSLEKKIEEQHAVIDLLDHDLAEARKALTLPPGWNKINKMEIRKDTDEEAFEALKSLSTTNV